MHNVSIELGSLDELFTAPEFDPLAGRAEELSGLERLANQLRPLPSGPVSARIVLPASERAADLEQRCRVALRAVLDRRIERNRNDACSLRGEGRATLWRGLLFLALCQLGSNLLGTTGVLLYQRWPLARERRLYENLREMRLEFEFAD